MDINLILKQYHFGDEQLLSHPHLNIATHTIKWVMKTQVPPPSPQG